MIKHQTSKRSAKERTGIDRLYKRVGVRKISFYYQHPDGSSETLATAMVGDRKGIADADRAAKRKALDIIEGKIIAGSVAQLIERFRDEIAPTHYLDQSKDGLAVRESGYKNLTKFFGKMDPKSLRMLHGYQYLDARAKAGAPAKANKELSLMSTICKYAVRWGVIEAMPFTDIMQNDIEKDVRTITRSQVVRFYLWSLRQTATFRNLGCAAMFTYLTGFRAAEVRPFHISGKIKEGVIVTSAKRKKGQAEVMKLREWSTRLRVVVARAEQTHSVPRQYLFANSKGQAYTRSGMGSVWQDAMFEWIATFDTEAAAALARKRAAELEYILAYKKGLKVAKYEAGYRLADHAQYFSLQDIRPAAITAKFDQRNVDAYDFAAHANPSTTHKHYDRRKIKKAGATE
ncbi:hypothetical protein [Janthinobacterium sp. UMAB-56]|uniref:hypothetical protein n=1 Tax=Janthinobacterium sp. UMAB-56 TaxID=1365361 RepID=UPI001C56C1CE|nr:hypothetical protein [Janthinobacterium sp. UMAB-56]